MANTDDAKLYEYAIILDPESDEDGNREKPELLVEPTTTLARSSKAVQIEAARAIPTDYEDRYDEIQIAVRPF